MKKSLMALCVAGIAIPSLAETIAEYAVDANATIDVPSGTTTRIEYLSGSAAATLTKTGDGVLELAIIGNTNVTIRVEAGTLKR